MNGEPLRFKFCLCDGDCFACFGFAQQPLRNDVAFEAGYQLALLPSKGIAGKSVRVCKSLLRGFGSAQPPSASTLMGRMRKQAPPKQSYGKSRDVLRSFPHQ